MDYLAATTKTTMISVEGYQVAIWGTVQAIQHYALIRYEHKSFIISTIVYCGSIKGRSTGTNEKKDVKKQYQRKKNNPMSFVRSE